MCTDLPSASHKSVRIVNPSNFDWDNLCIIWYQYGLSFLAGFQEFNLLNGKAEVFGVNDHWKQPM